MAMSMDQMLMMANMHHVGTSLWGVEYLASSS